MNSPEPFVLQPVCCKCASFKISKTYGNEGHSGVNCPKVNGKVVDHLHISCLDCGYTWVSWCKDHDKTKQAS